METFVFCVMVVIVSLKSLHYRVVMSFQSLYEQWAEVLVDWYVFASRATDRWCFTYFDFASSPGYRSIMKLNVLYLFGCYFLNLM